jgi:polyphosphate kinase 2
MEQADEKNTITREEFEHISSHEELLALIAEKNIDSKKISKRLQYEEELKNLQIELLKLQQWISKNKMRVVVIFEGRDAAGKGGNIRRFVEHLNPRFMRSVALTKPTEVESGQWYFRRYIKELPNPGEIVFFDRSWYNRAVVEPVMGFCNDVQYQKFMSQVPDFEHMLYEDGVVLIKLWFSISKEEQQKRFNDRLKTPLKRWKFSPVDQKGQELWERYTFYKNQMFGKTHTGHSPWITIKANNKKAARLESIRYVLSQFEYDGKHTSNTNIAPNPNFVVRHFRSK